MGESLSLLSLDELLRESEVLRETHAKEFSLSIWDIDAYIGDRAVLEEFERRGFLVLAGAWSSERLVGYIVWKIGSHAALPRKTVALLGPWFVEASLRGQGVGMELFEFSVAELRSREVEFALATLPWRKGLRSERGPFGVPFEISWMRALK